jgi:tRNA(Ile)-lysidine synthase
MKDSLLLAVRDFLEPRLVAGKPLLIGYSGGPDSKALLHLMLECRRFLPLELHIAHVDHGWREESRGEAQAIQRESTALGLPFHLKSLTLNDFLPGNTESQGREHRIRFFSRLYEEIGAQALLLGHQADDQAETVLKRLFEGASFPSLGGLSAETELQGMQVWRPLLCAGKSEILAWLEQNNLGYFVDPTNRDGRFLRGKMREELLPFLNASFGKQIGANLCRLGEESKEIKEYFRRLNHPILSCIDKGSLNLNPYLPLPVIQLKYLVKEWLEREGVTMSRQIVEGVANALNQSSGKKFCSNEGEFHVDKGFLCFFNLTL